MASDQIKTLLAANGFRPGFTPIPNELLDFLLDFLSGAELKVLLYVLRRTFGFGKGRDGISLTQICNGLVRRKTGRPLDFGTGLSKPAVIQAVRFLGNRGLLLSWAPSRTGRGAVKVYAVVLTGSAKERVDEVRSGNEKVNQVDPSSPTQKRQPAPGGSGNSANPSGPKRVSPVNTQKKAYPGNIEYSRDEAIRPPIYSQNQNSTSKGVHYDEGPEFSQQESTYWNPDPESD
jgi:hypothetical protein